MGAGGLIAGTSYICAGLVELALQGSSPQQPSQNGVQIVVLNSLPCDVEIHPWEGPIRTLTNVKPLTLPMNNVVVGDTKVQFLVSTPVKCGLGVQGRQTIDVEVLVDPGQVGYL